ncbi:terpene cyclase/mutase family protein [Actinomadura roseirufa]|uniref:terpene cyclase/mutase family protein n=1 Tax=Actinomadura roseirufa TaxID=2094049 RepID=UPI0013F15029|nr:prenyltransferase/squalene oxidase repeat-containing protein [Actinomadura roseirufa]
MTRRTELDNAVSQSVERAARALVALQGDDGRWDLGLSNKVSVDAHQLLVHTFLGLPQPPESTAVAAWIRSQQTSEGGWPTFTGGPDQVSTSVMAYLALRVAGDRADAPHLRAAAARITELGGPAACGMTTRLWLAMLGLLPWSGVRSLPPEVALLPARGPLSVNDVAVWARPALLSVAVITTLRPVRRLGLGVPELGLPPGSDASARSSGPGAYHQRTPSWPHRRSLARIRRWLLAHQDPDGCWGGTHAATMFAITALRSLGEPVTGPVLGHALDGLRTFLHPTEDGHLSVRFSHAEIWDSALSVLALQQSGCPSARPAVRRGLDWLITRQHHWPGAWSAHRPDLVPGGWPFQDGNLHCPDTDDTSMVVRALLGEEDGGARHDAARLRGLTWLAGMAGRDGGWAAFDADARVARVRAVLPTDPVPFVDPPTADVTAHAVEALAQAGDAHRHAVRRGVRWLLDAQEPDGSWYGRWGCNYVYGTSAVLVALKAAGGGPTAAAIRNGAAWLAAHRNPDGGWGEDHRSYRDPEWRGRGQSTASQTAWALMGLMAAGHRDELVEGGVEWLLRRQDETGLWPESLHTGTGTPWISPIRYGSYPKVFPLMALAAYRTGAPSAAPDFTEMRPS